MPEKCKGCNGKGTWFSPMRGDVECDRCKGSGGNRAFDIKNCTITIGEVKIDSSSFGADLEHRVVQAADVVATTQGLATYVYHFCGLNYAFVRYLWHKSLGDFECPCGFKITFDWSNVLPINPYPCAGCGKVVDADDDTQSEWSGPDDSDVVCLDCEPDWRRPSKRVEFYDPFIP